MLLLTSELAEDFQDINVECVFVLEIGTCTEVRCCGGGQLGKLLLPDSTATGLEHFPEKFRLDWGRFKTGRLEGSLVEGNISRCEL